MKESFVRVFMPSDSRRFSIVLGLAVLTEGVFASALYFGETPDMNRGGLAGWLGWLGHLPAALVFNLMSPFDIYSDVLSPSLFVLGCLQWALIWATPLVILPRVTRRPS